MPNKLIELNQLYDTLGAVQGYSRERRAGLEALSKEISPNEQIPALFTLLRPLIGHLTPRTYREEITDVLAGFAATNPNFKSLSSGPVQVEGVHYLSHEFQVKNEQGGTTENMTVLLNSKGYVARIIRRLITEGNSQKITDLRLLMVGSQVKATSIQELSINNRKESTPNTTTLEFFPAKGGSKYLVRNYQSGQSPLVSEPGQLLDFDKLTAPSLQFIMQPGRLGFLLEQYDTPIKLKREINRATLA